MSKDLIQIIKDNPGCVATIDNDAWWIHAAPPKPVEGMGGDGYDDLGAGGELVHDGEVECGRSGHLYGGAILDALAKIVGMKIESV